MKSLNLYRTSVFFVAFASSLAMAPAEGNLVPPFLFLGISAPLWWARNRADLLPPKTTNQLLLIHGILSAVALALIFLGPTLLASWFHVSILLLAYTFFTARKAWSYGLVYALSLLQVLVSSAPHARGQQILILAYLLLMATFSLVLHHLMGGMRERVRTMPRPDPRLDPLEAELSELPRVNRFFLTSIGVGVAVFLFAVPLFLLLPRNPAPPEKKETERSKTGKPETGLDGELRSPWPVPPDLPPIGSGGGSGLKHSGFSGEIDLGHWGILFDSAREVLRVMTYIAAEPHLPDLGTFYLKGVVLDRFDGRRWSATRAPLTRIRDGSDGRRDNLIRFEDFNLMDPGIVLQHVFARQEFGPVRFHMPVPVGYCAPRVYRDPNGALWARPEGFAEEEVETYFVYSRPWRPTPSLRRRLATSRASAARRYLELPPGMERVKALARSLSSPTDSPWTTVQKFADHLREAYTYSQERFTPPKDASPLEVFLFDRKAGHCELFASALAVMLRSRGVPARIVGGFRGGTQRWELDEYYIAVRESNAHAWVEVKLDVSRHWIPVDPTPATLPDEEEQEAAPPPPDPKKKRPDSLVGFILKYDRDNQRWFLGRVLGGVGSLLKGFGRLVGSVLTAVPLPLLLVIALIVSGVGAILIHRGQRRREALRVLGRGAEREAMRSLSFYVEFLRVMKRLGYRRGPSQTPLEFAEAVAASDASLDGVWKVTELFHRIRYRGDLPRREELSRALVWIRSLRRRTHATGEIRVDR